jgi:methyl-accepting chemotaxis protein
MMTILKEGIQASHQLTQSRLGQMTDEVQSLKQEVVARPGEALFQEVTREIQEIKQIVNANLSKFGDFLKGSFDLQRLVKQVSTLLRMVPESMQRLKELLNEEVYTSVNQLIPAMIDVSSQLKTLHDALIEKLDHQSQFEMLSAKLDLLHESVRSLEEGMKKSLLCFISQIAALADEVKKKQMNKSPL